MRPPLCPHCDQPLTRVLDAPYGFWEWDGGKFQHRTAATDRVDVSPWLHWDCMGELRDFHPQDAATPT